ncbi:MAG: histidine kinase, partial [Bacteroidota bacterium]
QQALEKEKLETELKFLKSQFNPHFLFNTINSIFVLIHKNPDRASESLAKFSELLRYQLYECNEAKIPLKHEISYLENFIELEKLRLDHHFELHFQNNIGSNANWMIAPFLLIPFVENAFKHVSQEKDQTNWINIRLELEYSTLKMQVSNSYSKLHNRQTALLDYGGIGLKNVKRRLDLLYDKNYNLQILEEEQHFLVELSLNLKEEINLTVQDLQVIR